MIPARNYRHARESGHPGRAGTAFAAPGPPLPRGRQKKRRWEPSVWFIPLGVIGVPLPEGELLVGLSVIVLGLLIGTTSRLPISAALAIVGVFAIAHGHAHGA